MTYTIWQALGIFGLFLVILVAAPFVTLGVARGIADAITGDTDNQDGDQGGQR